MKDSTLGKRAAATVVWVAMKTKTKIGMDLKTKKKKPTKRQILSKQNALVSYLFYLLGVFSSLVSGAAEVAKAINNNKAVQRQLKKLKRHNARHEWSWSLSRSIQAIRNYKIKID